jgi:carbonic anhydrase/acetyltransferase-like protein (isoleucine patch superfamily)
VDDLELDGDWDHSQLPANVVLGQRCWIEARSSFRRFFSQRDPGLVVGDDVVIHAGTGFGIEPGGWVEIGDRSLLVGASLMCADHIAIGSDVVISYGVTITDADWHPRDPDLRRRDVEALAPGADPSNRPGYETAPVSVGDGARIGINAIILKGVRIGERATVGPGAVVARDVPAGVTVEGNPARPVEVVRP